jgi:hypothetical protein
MLSTSSLIRIQKIPEMIYYGMITGFALEIIVPRTETNDRIFSRKHIIFAGMCFSAWMALSKDKDT